MNAAAGIDSGTVACRTLHALGARHVFGLPGTQTTTFYEALRRSPLRAIVPMHELSAAFMAGAYHRVSGTPGILSTISGPGLAYALAGLAEARLDSAAVIHLVNAPAPDAIVGFGPQALDQRALLAPMTKAVFRAAGGRDLDEVLREAWALSLSGEPGPVAVEMAADDGGTAVAPATFATPVPEPDDLTEAVAFILEATRPVIIAGQGALATTREIIELASRWHAPLVTTPSARGILPETTTLAMGFDVLRGGLDATNALIAEADVVLAIGAKLAHNGSAGGRLVLPAEKLVRVDTSAASLAAVYPARHALLMRSADFLARLAAEPLERSRWPDAAIASHRNAIRTHTHVVEPALADVPAPAWFAALARSLPRDVRLVTDTGMHQVMARRHLDVMMPGGLMFPSDLQSMGFGLPAAIASRLADPRRPVVALIGDGGLRMMGFDIATAVREGVALTVVVISDGALNQIRLQQLTEHGVSSGTDIGPVDLLAFADAVGAGYELAHSPEALETAIERGLRSDGVTLIEVPAGDNSGIRSAAMKARAKRVARAALGERLSGLLKRIRR